MVLPCVFTQNARDIPEDSRLDNLDTRVAMSLHTCEQFVLRHYRRLLILVSLVNYSFTPQTFGDKVSLTIRRGLSLVSITISEGLSLVFIAISEYLLFCQLLN